MANLESISYINLGNGNHPIDAVTVGGKTVPDVSNFITKSVSDLTNYYLKSETYSQAEVNTLIGNILQFHYEIAASTSAVSSPENNVLYLIGPTGDGADKYEEYVYPNSTVGWTKIGDTSIDLADYVTVDMLNETLEDYKTSSEIEEIELIIAAALNDLNERLIYIEEDALISASVRLYDVEGRVSDLETNASSFLSSESDPVFSSSVAATITASDISTWNAKQDTIVFDSVPTENSDNLVKSGDLYTVITENERVVAHIFNDLNVRISNLESVDLSSDYVSISQYNDDEEVIAAAINEMDDRIQDLENSVLTSEVDPIFSASAAAGITSTDISNWNSKTSNTGTLTDIIFNGVSASVSNGVASISYSVDLSDYVSLSDYESDEFVFATAINDLNDRITVLESDAITATALTSVLKYKGTIGTGGTVSTLPATHSVGDVYVVSVSGSYAGQACEVGDYIICNTAGTSANNAHWDVITGENQVDNKSASLANAGSSVTVATVDGTDITVTTPSTWTGLTNTGTITGISMNGSSKGTSGNVDLGTVITAVSFNGTAASISNGVASITAREMPSVSSTDNGKVLQVVNGSWALVTPINVYSSTSAPDNQNGNNGDIYIQTS